MPNNDYDRYSKFRTDNSIEMVPFIEIPKQAEDLYVEYHRGETRMDLLSNEYYGTPNYGWLILQANPEYGSMEFAIPDRSILRIPFPLDAAIVAYKEGIDGYNKKYK